MRFFGFLCEPTTEIVRTVQKKRGGCTPRRKQIQRKMLREDHLPRVVYRLQYRKWREQSRNSENSLDRLIAYLLDSFGNSGNLLSANFIAFLHSTPIIAPRTVPKTTSYNIVINIQSLIARPALY